MIGKILIFFFLLSFNSLNAEIKDQIILNLKNTNNLTFDFKQQIDEKIESGYCIIKYPKKIYCSYNTLNNKKIVSNGKSLVIKNDNINQYYLYPLNRTPLEFILNKEYLIQKIINSKSKSLNNRYLGFTIENESHEINIFFDKKTSYLTGWQTEDIYQNLVITFISNIKINQKISNNIFQLPSKK
jgi:outer membrane lipoprotein-sorting protein